MSNNTCKCWCNHVTDPAHRAAIERQIEVEKAHAKRNPTLKKHTKAVVDLLKEMLKPCPTAAPQPSTPLAPKGWDWIET